MEFRSMFRAVLYISTKEHSFNRPCIVEYSQCAIFCVVFVHSLYTLLYRGGLGVYIAYFK